MTDLGDIVTGVVLWAVYTVGVFAVGYAVGTWLAYLRVLGKLTHSARAACEVDSSLVVRVFESARRRSRR